MRSAVNCNMCNFMTYRNRNCLRRSRYVTHIFYAPHVASLPSPRGKYQHGKAVQVSAVANKNARQNRAVDKA